ncbi:helix-turn-helix domain-containing protein [Vibrio owensii]|uniref:helix-turn-helix domain-containing protein n=1 Tax=Vibrio harveyi group TaxID=717610 RepID=UPI003CC52ED4
MIKRSRRTPFGRVLAEIRFKQEQRLSDMGEALGISASFLSALELGRKQVSDSFLQKVFDVYKIEPEQQVEYRKLAEMSGTSIRISVSGASDAKREFVSMLSKKLGELTDDEVTKLKEQIA